MANRKPNLGHLPHPPQDIKPPQIWKGWTSKEISILFDHPDMTAKELHDSYLPRHTPKGIQRMRERKGRYKPTRRL
ncbi:MAG: hypothetical protein E7A71_10880, partial [Enterococcus faecium]|nr:hypothetical protein [Enterococcus faecium]